MLLLPRSTPSAEGVSSRAVAALLDRFEESGVEGHSIMVVRHGRVVAEGWWAPYSAGRVHLLYSVTKSFTAIATGLAVHDGRLALDDRVVDVLSDRVPDGIGDQARRITVEHLLTMTSGHVTDSLTDAWELEPDDLVKGFLRVPFAHPEGTRHSYDNATTYLLARMVERVYGRELPDLMEERLFRPMGVTGAEWDRVASGAVFGFHGLHLTTEALAAFGELLRNDGRWGGEQLVPAGWVRQATRQHIGSEFFQDGTHEPGGATGYGYQFWTMAPHGFYADGAYGQHCVVIPAADLVVAVTAAVTREAAMPQGVFECLLPGLDRADGAEADEALAERLGRLSLRPVDGSAAPGRSATARIDATTADSALPGGTTVTVEPAGGGWRVRLGALLDVEAGHGTWRESAPLGRPVVATGAWQGGTFTADLYVITTPHRVRLVVDAEAGTATAVWSTVPLTGPDLLRHVRAPLITRPDVA